MFANLKTTQLNLRKEIIILEYERGLLYRDGKFMRLLEAGRYRFWNWDNINVAKVSLRQMSEVISGQEILTSDRIGVRVSLIAKYVIADPVVAVNSVENFAEQLYQDLQLALRESVSSRDIDTLLEVRQEVSNELLERVAPECAVYGLELRRVGVRDIVLPGSIRDVFLKEIEADRKGRADLIKARHEVAAARARANTAKILTENPAVLRLQEIDALIELAGKQGNVIMLPNLADMLTQRIASNNGGETNGNGQ